MKLSEQLLAEKTRERVVADCCKMIDRHLAAKSGIGGIALRTAFGAIKGISPEFVPHVVDQLLPQFLGALDPLWRTGMEKGDPVAYLMARRADTAEALLAVTDARAKQAKRQLVRGTYDRLRDSARKHVEEAVPDVVDIVQKYA